MSDIPPALPSSAAQTGFQAREVSKARETRDAADAHTATNRVRSLAEAGSTVETTDEDVAVFSDSEGTGSQGRATDQKAPPDEPAESPGGISRDEDGRLHVDLEA